MRRSILAVLAFTTGAALPLAAQSDDGAWFMGRVVCLNLAGVDPSDGRLDLGGACEQRTIGG